MLKITWWLTDPTLINVIINVITNFLSFILTHMELTEFWRRHTFIIQWNMMRSITLRWLTRKCLEHTHMLIEYSLNLGWYGRVWLNRTNILSSTNWVDINPPKTSNWSRLKGLMQWLKWHHLNLPMLMLQTTSQLNLTSYTWPLNSCSNLINLRVDILQKYCTQDERGC